MDRKPWLIPRPTALAQAMHFLPFHALRRIYLLREILSDLRGKERKEAFTGAATHRFQNAPAEWEGGKKEGGGGKRVGLLQPLVRVQ